MNVTRRRAFSSWLLSLSAAGWFAVSGCGKPQVNFKLNVEGEKTAGEAIEDKREQVRAFNESLDKEIQELKEKKLKVDQQKERINKIEDRKQDVEEEIRKLVKRQKNQRDARLKAMYVMFGTPDKPFIFRDSGLDQKKLETSAGPSAEKTGLFRKHCAHCHGISGDGAGPTARFLYPYPRDYRRGIFKFKSTAPLGEMPTRDDLKRVMREGINGTAMPSFKILLREDQIDALADYVVYLSMRGMVEIALKGVIDDMDDEEFEDSEDGTLLPRLIDDLPQRSNKPLAFAQWEEAKVFMPPARDEEMIAQQDAAKIFTDANRANCFSCHGVTGLGDGPQTNFDSWNEKKKGQSPEIIARRFALPIQRIRPRNFRLGIFRGGRRPVDIYRRIANGIYGSGMPAHAASGPEDKKKLQPYEIWALVDYVRSLAYEEGGARRRKEKYARRKERL